MGINYLEDLKTLNFTKLQGSYFRFFLPTFHATDNLKAGPATSIKIWQDKQRLQKFLKTGCIGLQTMDDALLHERRAARSMAKKDLHSRGLALPAMNRSGVGWEGSFLAYPELNENVRYALTNLGLRIAGDFSSG